MLKVEFNASDLRRFNEKLSTLERTLADTNDLYEQIGGIVESQTKRRISDEKTGPDGQDWDAWSDVYASRRSPGASLLQGGQQAGLLESIEYQVNGNEVTVGSNLIYAAIHQFGGEDVGKPGLHARPYLGLSPENTEELTDSIEDWVETQIQQATQGQ